MEGLDIRGEMERAAAELSAPAEETSPVSESESPSEVPEPAAEEVAAAPATEEPPPAAPEASPPPDDTELPVGGSIPVPRVRKILENARAKARAEVEAQLGWAKDRDRAQVEEAMRVVEFANTNPVEFYRAVTERLRSNPALRAEVERVWAPATPAAKEPADAKPEPDVLLEDGRLFYSAPQQEKLLAWQERQFEAKVSARLKPIEDARRDQERQQVIDHESKRLYDDVVQWPGMSDAENRKAVADYMVTHKVAVDVAYRAAVLPRLTDTKAIEERVRKQVLADLQKKGRAGTENPQRVIAAPENFRGKTIREILEATAAELGME